MKILFTLVFMFSLLFCYSQNKYPEISILGFGDVFYTYDFNQPTGTSRQTFLYNHNRHNEFNLNLGLIKIGIEDKNYRANIAFQTGTYVNDNLAAEPGVLKNIFEANIGTSLNKKKTLWFDAGILPSHIGFESAVSMDNLTLTRSLLAENSPYFLTGAKLTFYPNETIEMAALVVNGWQRIQRLEQNSLPSFGTQVNYNPSDKFTLNWSTFIGTDTPDSARKMRYFNNFYGVFKISKKLNLIAGFDIGAQQKKKENKNYDIWFSPTAICQFKISEKWQTSLRGEYYHDESGVILATNTTNGFQTLGFSWNLDFSPAQNLVYRIEARKLSSKDKIFPSDKTLINSNFIIAASLSLKLEGKIK